jgi:hypothetical protein
MLSLAGCEQAMLARLKSDGPRVCKKKGAGRGEKNVWADSQGRVKGIAVSTYAKAISRRRFGIIRH